MNKCTLMINQLQKSITQNNLTCIVESSVFNQRILVLLQINGFINGFKLVNTKQIIIYFKFVNNSNVIKRIFRFKRAERFSRLYKKREWFHSVGFTYFTIMSGRHGLCTNKDYLFQKHYNAVPILGII